MDFSTIDWKALFSSEAAITLYVALILFGYRHLKIHFQWNTERWEGMITTAFLAAENSGALSGHAKLQVALERFNHEYQEVYDKPPSALDLKDAALDFARKAMEFKFVPKAV